MTAEKIIKINSEHEVDILRERVNLLESVLEYSTAETLNNLKKENKTLTEEAIALRSADEQKDKIIAEKDKLINEIRKNFNTQLKIKTSELRRQFEVEKKQALDKQRNNIEYYKVKPEKEKVNIAQEERDRIKEMYDALLSEHKLSHENEKAIIGLCTDILNNIKTLIKSGETSEEIIKKIDSGVESVKSISIKEECEQIHNLLTNGHSKKEIAALMYPDLARREQKVQDRINSKTYINMFGQF